MLTKRPDRKPNLTLTNLRMEGECDDSIFYNFAEAKDQTKTEFWQIPIGSTFEPNIEILPNTAYAVWSTPIREEYTTTTGKKRTRERFDWEWIEPLEDYQFDTMTDTTRHAKNRILVEAYNKMIESQNNFSTLFEQVNPLAKKK